MENFEKNFNRYLGFVFEGIVSQFLIGLNKRGKLPFRFSRIGRWWHKNEEIDLLALNEREKKALFVEVKWKELNEREAWGILRDLKRKAQLVDLEDWEKSYCIVGKRVRDKERLRKKGALVYDLGDFTLSGPRPSSSGRATS